MSIEIELKCNGCNRVLSAAWDRQAGIVNVDACEHCVDEAAAAAHEKGKAEGIEEARAEAAEAADGQ